MWSVPDHADALQVHCAGRSAVGTTRRVDAHIFAGVAPATENDSVACHPQEFDSFDFVCMTDSLTVHANMGTAT